jgi:hypothetical protein
VREIFKVHNVRFSTLKMNWSSRISYSMLTAFHEPL